MAQAVSSFGQRLELIYKPGLDTEVIEQSLQLAVYSRALKNPKSSAVRFDPSIRSAIRDNARLE